MLNGVQLPSNRLFSQGLAGHDERATNVAIFHETLTIGEVQGLGHLQSGNASRIGNWNHNIDVVVWPGFKQSLSKTLSLIEARLVDRHAVNDRIGPSKVDVFEDAR